MNKHSRIYIAGHNGLVGSAILEYLKKNDYENLIFRTRKELDLSNQLDVKKFFNKEKPEYVFLCAAKVGGIIDNKNHKADFIYQNLQIQNNVIHQSFLHKVKKMIFIASTSVYPKDCKNTKETDLMSGKLDYSNESYAIAKIAGIKMCEAYNIQYNANFIPLTPTNLYGERDRFDLEKAHVIPALIRKFYLAKLLKEQRYSELLLDLNMQNLQDVRNYLEKFGIANSSFTIWGSGNAKREFLHVDDLVEACIFIMNNVDFKNLYKSNDLEIKNTHINIGSNENISIKDLAYLIKGVVGYNGDIFFDKTQPEGTLSRFIDCAKIHSLGWKHKIKLENGVKKLYNWYLQNNKGLRK